MSNIIFLLSVFRSPLDIVEHSTPLLKFFAIVLALIRSFV
nr:MAG TPA: hypothetical protein [Caudoviricetes sp.]